MADKIEITNLTDRVLDFNIGVKDRVVQTDDVRPGESKGVAVQPDDPHLVALIKAGAVTVKNPTGEARKATEAVKAVPQAKATATEEASKPA